MLVFSIPFVIEVFDRGNGTVSVWLFRDINFVLPRRKVRWWVRSR